MPHGFTVFLYAENSVDEPMANSSMLVLPRMTAPASFNRAAMVASYGLMYPSRIREPAVVGVPVRLTRSFSATGTPRSGGSSLSAAAPAARAVA